MNYVITGRKPEAVFRFFEEISAIPRGSYNEKGIADYLVAFAQARGLECYRDDLHNVLIKKPATPGQEGRAPVLFQGHTDMVCEKNNDTQHDFLKDPLKLYVDGKFLRAKGTTLGADNGIAVAMMMAMLDGALEAHPAIECLFTTAEEVGLNGAQGFDYSLVSARRMVNMDSEDLGIVTAGCAGGVRSDLTLAASVEPFAGACVKISVAGLMGGHSGACIHCGRANANKVMGRLLAALIREEDARLISVNGGSKDNAIPRECDALVAVPDEERATTLLTEVSLQIANELSEEDRDFRAVVESADGEAVMMSREDTRRAVAILNCTANGVLNMSMDIKDLVESSRNLGVVTTEGDEISFVFSSRSSVESRLDASILELDTVAAVTGCKIRHYSRYPGWEYAKASKLRDAYLAAYRDVTGKDAEVNVIHAGLECGIIRSHVPDMDMISIGPDMRDIHSPDEALDLDSTEAFWKTVARLVEIL